MSCSAIVISLAVVTTLLVSVLVQFIAIFFYQRLKNKHRVNNNNSNNNNNRNSSTDNNCNSNSNNDNCNSLRQSQITAYDTHAIPEQSKKTFCNCASFTNIPYVPPANVQRNIYQRKSEPNVHIQSLANRSASDFALNRNRNARLSYLNSCFEDENPRKFYPSNCSNSESLGENSALNDVDIVSPYQTRKPSKGQISATNDSNLLLSTYNAGFPIGNCLKEIYQITERSLSRQICNKLVVCVSHLVTDAGDTLILDNMGISLFIPPGAIESGKKQIISLVLNWDLSDNPLMTGKESLVSPLVYCGPHGLKLKRNCLLTFKHCCFNTNELKILKSETELTGHKDWKELDKDKSSARSNDDDQFNYNITQNECQVSISSFTLFTAVMTILEECEDDTIPQSSKWLQLAAFSCPFKSNSNHYQIRIYFLNKTPCALQWAIQNEAKFGGVLCCPEKVFLFDGRDNIGHGKDMIVNTIYTSEGWDMIEDADEESNRIPFLYIWHGKCPYASLCFHYQLPSSKPKKELSLKFNIFQESLENMGEKLIVQNQARPNMNDDSGDDQFLSSCQKHKTPHIKIQVSVDGYKENQDIYSAANSLKCKKIPHDLRMKLKLLLDPSNLFDQNWKALASYLNLDPLIRYMEEKDSPTDRILDILEQKMYSLEDIRAILEEIGRIDAASEIQEFLQGSDTQLHQDWL